MDENENLENEKTPAEIMKEMQEEHKKQIDALRKEFEAEKTAHAKDVKELLLNNKQTTGNAQSPVEDIRERMRKKYYR